MRSEKFVVATLDNQSQINIRNILSPLGYVFLGNCSDPVSLIRLVRNYDPDFCIIDMSTKISEFASAIKIIDEEFLCACIILAEQKNDIISSLIEGSHVVAFCPKPLNKDFFGYVVDIAVVNYFRVSKMSQRLKEMTENYETRKSVEKAKWLIMSKLGISEKEAYERIRKKSMDSRMPLKDVADAIIFTYETMEANNKNNKK